MRDVILDTFYIMETFSELIMIPNTLANNTVGNNIDFTSNISMAFKLG